MGQGGEGEADTPKLLPFSVSVLAVVTNKVETAIWFRSQKYKYVDRLDRCEDR